MLKTYDLRPGVLFATGSGGVFEITSRPCPHSGSVGLRMVGRLGKPLSRKDIVTAVSASVLTEQPDVLSARLVRCPKNIFNK